MPQGYTVDRVLEEATLGAGNKLEETVRITFRVGDDGPFSVRVAKGPNWMAEARPQIEKVVADVKQLRA